MARVQLSSLGLGVFQDHNGTVQAGVTPTVLDANGAPAVVYAAATGGSTTTPTTDASGGVAGWVDPGRYTITVGAVTKTADAIEGTSAKVATASPLNVQYPAYAAKGDGSTTDRAAIQAAIAALPVTQSVGSYQMRGGVIFLPKAVYVIDAPLSLAGTFGVTFKGEGGRGAQAGAATTLVYTGATGSLIDGRGGIEWHAQSMRFEYTNTGYAGNLINFDWVGTCRTTGSYTAGTATMPLDDTSTLTASGTIRLQTLAAFTDITYTGKTPTSLTGCSGGAGTFASGTLALQTATGADVSMSMDDCVVQGNQASGATGANALIRLNHCLTSRISATSFNRTQTAILLGDPNYAVSIKIEANCTFNNSSVKHIRGAGGLEAIGINGNTFEPLTNQSAGAFAADVAVPVLGMSFTNNWGGDVSLGGGSWVKGAFTGLAYSGNRMSNPGPITTTTGSVSSGATTVPLTSAAGFPTGGGTAVIAITPLGSPPVSQSFAYTGVSGLNLTGVTGITATFGSGSTVGTGAHIELQGNSKGIAVDGSEWEGSAFGVLMDGVTTGLAVTGTQTANVLQILSTNTVPLSGGLLGVGGTPNMIYGPTRFEDNTSTAGFGLIVGMLSALLASEPHSGIGWTQGIGGYPDGTLVIQPKSSGADYEVIIVGGSTGNKRLRVNDTGIGFQSTAPIAKPTVTGSRSANAALASLLTALANYGLITDSSS